MKTFIALTHQFFRSKWQKLSGLVLLAEHVITQLTPDIPMSTNKFTIVKRYANVRVLCLCINIVYKYN